MRSMHAKPVVHRSLASAFGAVLLVGGVAACSESAGPDEGTTVEDVAEENTDVAEESAEGLGEESAEGLGEETEGFELDAETQEVFGDLDSFMDQTVTVSAEVQEVISEQAFVLQADGQGLLVVGAQSLGVPLEPGMVAQVNGVVQTFVLVDVEESLGVDLDDESFLEFEDQHYIVADNVDLLSGENE